jgi:nucleotide-binding universal stress UspA family protein
MKSKITKVIIPTDFSALSESAFKTGLAIAKRQNAEITILHVMDRLDYIEPSKAFLPFGGIEAYHSETIGKYMDMLAAKIHGDTGIKVSSKVLEGLPSEKICGYAYQQKASLIVMGTHGISGSRELFMGSDAFKIIKNCSCPALTVPSDWNKTTFGRIIFPVQLKPGTFEKYFYARPIIEKNNSELYILGLSERNKPSELKELATLVDRLKLQLHSDSVTYQSAFSPCTDFPEKVAQVAVDFLADLAIVAVHPADDPRASKSGPFAEQLLNLLKIPILSIKPFSQHVIPDLQMELADNWVKIVN